MNHLAYALALAALTLLSVAGAADAGPVVGVSSYPSIVSCMPYHFYLQPPAPPTLNPECISPP